MVNSKHQNQTQFYLLTKRSILKIAKDLDLDPIETKIPIDDVNRFAEAGAMGTAAVISPFGSLTYKGKKHVFGDGKDAGPITQKLYDTLTGIQFSDLEDKYGWIVKLKNKQIKRDLPQKISFLFRLSIRRLDRMNACPIH